MDKHIEIHVTVHYAGAVDMLDQQDQAALDVLDTEATIMRRFTTRIQHATGADTVVVEVRRDDAGDTWSISGTSDDSEYGDIDTIVHDIITYFPWHYEHLWAVFKK